MNTINRGGPLVSVIVTTRNEESAIRRCLESIVSQTYKKIETLVIDNSSTDRTREIAGQFTDLVFTKGPERSSQRNYGAHIAKGTWLLFLDADMELSPTVVDECVSGAKQHVYACIIPEKSVGSGFWSRCKILERTYYEGLDWMEAARFYSKEVFISLHGFDEAITGPEDFDLSQRFTARYGVNAVTRIKSPIHHDEGVIMLGNLLRKKYYYGKKMHRYISKNENKSVSGKQANPFNRYLLFFQKPGVFLTDPIHATGMILMKTLELGALGLGMIAGRV
jgi:glycosyltransferase involved in cell wall biosynthesis